MFKSRKSGGGGILGTVQTRMAHATIVPGLGNRDLRLLQDAITAEKSVLNATAQLSSDYGKAAEALKGWGQGEGEDLGDVLSHASELLIHYATTLGQMVQHEASIRTHLKNIRTREEGLDDLKKRRRAVGTKAEAAEKKLAGMGSEHKKLTEQTDLLTRLREEMRDLDTQIMNEDAALGDFKRTSTKDLLALKFGSLHEAAEKATIISDFGLMLIERIPLEATAPGHPRAHYFGHDATSQLTGEATKVLSQIRFDPPTFTTSPASPGAMMSPPSTRSHQHASTFGGYPQSPAGSMGEFGEAISPARPGGFATYQPSSLHDAGHSPALSSGPHGGSYGSSGAVDTALDSFPPVPNRYPEHPSFASPGSPQANTASRMSTSTTLDPPQFSQPADRSFSDSIADALAADRFLTSGGVSEPDYSRHQETIPAYTPTAEPVTGQNPWAPTAAATSSAAPLASPPPPPKEEKHAHFAPTPEQSPAEGAVGYPPEKAGFQSVHETPSDSPAGPSFHRPNSSPFDSVPSPSSPSSPSITKDNRRSYDDGYVNPYASNAIPAVDARVSSPPLEHSKEPSVPATQPVHSQAGPSEHEEANAAAAREVDREITALGFQSAQTASHPPSTAPMGYSPPPGPLSAPTAYLPPPGPPPGHVTYLPPSGPPPGHVASSNDVTDAERPLTPPTFPEPPQKPVITEPEESHEPPNPPSPPASKPSYTLPPLRRLSNTSFIPPPASPSLSTVSSLPPGGVVPRTISASAFRRATKSPSLPPAEPEYGSLPRPPPLNLTEHSASPATPALNVRKRPQIPSDGSGGGGWTSNASLGPTTDGSTPGFYTPNEGPPPPSGLYGGAEVSPPPVSKSPGGPRLPSHLSYRSDSAPTSAGGKGGALNKLDDMIPDEEEFMRELAGRSSLDEKRPTSIVGSQGAGAGAGAAPGQGHGQRNVSGYDAGKFATNLE